MNEDELKRNSVLTEWVVKDLNEGGNRKGFSLCDHQHCNCLAQSLLCRFSCDNYTGACIKTCNNWDYKKHLGCKGVHVSTWRFLSCRTRTTKMLSLWTTWQSPWKCWRKTRSIPNQDTACSLLPESRLMCRPQAAIRGQQL